VHEGHGVADDARGTMELIEDLPVAQIDCPEPSVEGAVESHATGGAERTAPVLEHANVW